MYPGQEMLLIITPAGEFDVYLCDRSWTAVCSITTSPRQTTATTPSTTSPFSWWWIWYGLLPVFLVGILLAGVFGKFPVGCLKVRIYLFKLIMHYR